MGRRLEYEVKTSVRLNMSNPQHVKINDVIQNLDPKIFKSKNQFIIDAIQFYIDNYGKETFVIKKKEKERAEYIRSEDIDDIKEEVIEAATNEARKEVIRLLGGVISGMNVGQPVIMQAANSEAQEPTEDVMDDADVAGLAMGWMSKGDWIIMRRVMGAVGTVILEIFKWILRIILGALKLVLGLARIILLLFAMVARIFLSFVRMGTF